MSVIEEVSNKAGAAIAESHLYASPYRSLYIGRLGPYLHIKKASSVLIVGLEQDLLIDSQDEPRTIDRPVRARSIMVPAETTLSVFTGNSLIAIYVLDYLGRDLFMLSRSARVVKTTSGLPVYIAIAEQEAFLSQIMFIYRHQLSGAQAIRMLTSIYNENNLEAAVDSRIEKVIEFIKNGDGLHLEIPELAAYVNLSVPRFSQLFKQTTGTNVRRFKIWCRQYLIVENLSKGLSFA
jgi:AraC-like DNA-binding protein